MNIFNRLPGFRFFRMAEDGGSGAPAAGATIADANGTSASVKTGSDGKSTSTMGEVADTSQKASSASASTSSIGTGTDDAAKIAADFKTLLGDLASDPTLKDVPDVKTMAQRLIDTKKMVGQKLGIPDDKSTPEAKAEFYKALGVPDKAEDYGLKAPADLPADVKSFYETDMLAGFGKLAKDLNLTKAQAEGLQKWNDGEMLKIIQKVTSDTTRSDADFDKEVTKVFGDQKTAVMEKAQVDIIKYAPVELRKEAEKLPNRALALVAATIAGIRKELGGEDKGINNDNETSSARSPIELRQEMRALMATPEFNNPFAKGREVHQQTKDKVTALSREIAQLESDKKKRK